MKIALLFIFLFTPIITFGQTYYFPKGKVTWIEKKTTYRSTTEVPPEYIRIAYVFDKDTVINEELYRNVSVWKVDSTGFKLGVGYYEVTFKDEKIGDIGAVHNTEDGKIYYRSYGNLAEKYLLLIGNYDYTFPAQTDVLLYDFSLNTGDTISNPVSNPNKVVIDSVQFIPLGGSTRKLMYVHCLGSQIYNYPLSGKWVEGIGSLNGLRCHPSQLCSIATKNKDWAF